MKLKAARTLADYIVNPTEDCIIPYALDKNVANVMAEAMK